MNSKVIGNQSTAFARRAQWPRLIMYVTSLWSFTFGLLGLYWLLGGVGFPFGVNDPRGKMMGSYIANMNVAFGATTIALLGLFGTIIALAMTRKSKQRFLIFLLQIYAWIVSVVLLFIIPDSRILQAVAYLFMFYFDLLDWNVFIQVFCMMGGILWGITGLAYFRISRAACVNCGRTEEGLSVKTATKWGKVFTYCAVFMALPYGIVRFFWAIGIPLGTENTEIIGDFMGEAILAGLCFGGAILTLALIHNWGERFPRWCLFLAGKRVPVWLVIAPATFIAVILFLTGLKVFPPIIMMIEGGLITTKNWGEMIPTLFWLPWGLSLGLATLTYYVRRRGRCKHCGRD